MQNERWSDIYRKARIKIFIGIMLFAVGCIFNMSVVSLTMQLGIMAGDPRFSGGTFSLYMLSMTCLYFGGVFIGDGLGNMESVDNRIKVIRDYSLNGCSCTE